MNFSRAGHTATSVGNLETGLSCSTEQLDSSHFQLMTGSDLRFRNQFSVAQPSLKTFLLSSCFLPASSMNSLAVISLLMCLDDPSGYLYWAGFWVARDELDNTTMRAFISTITCRQPTKNCRKMLPRPQDRERLLRTQ